MNESGWFSLYQGYILRAHSTGESTDNFRVPEPMRLWIRERLEKVTASKKDKTSKGREILGADFSPADRQLARLLESPANPNLRLIVPPSDLPADEWKRACRLGRALMALARRKPYRVRSAVLGYVYAVTTDRYVIMTDENDADFGKLLIELVRELHIVGLKIHLVGFHVGCNMIDIGQWLRVLELPPATPVDFVRANNLDNFARLKHVGIRICWGGTSRASREWHEVALLAAIIELWRSVTRSRGFELTA
jgi:hypothetical protein